MRGLKPVYRAAIVRLLSIGPLSVAEIALRLPCALTTAYDNVRELRKAGVVRVHSYEKSGNMTTALMQRAGCQKATVVHGSGAYA